jgi:hypothetical protein
MKIVRDFLYRYNREPDFVNSFNGKSIGKYYITWDINHIMEKFPENEEGIPVLDYDRVSFLDFSGKKISPLVIAQTALAYHNAFHRSGLEEHEKKFLKLTDWLVENQCRRNKFMGAWLIEYDNPRYQLKAPWICGMAQGQAISALVRAYDMTSNDGYLKAAEDAVKVFEVPIEEGGLRVEIDGKYIQYEEAPTSFTPHILNHAVYAILGLFDLAVVAKSKNALRLYEEGVWSIKEMLKQYDTGYWSRYEIVRPTIRNHYNLASPLYHATHIALLRVLYSITKDETFLRYAEKWEGYRSGVFARTMDFIYFVFKVSITMRKHLKGI